MSCAEINNFQCYHAMSSCTSQSGSLEVVGLSLVAKCWQLTSDHTFHPSQAIQLGVIRDLVLLRV